MQAIIGVCDPGTVQTRQHSNVLTGIIFTIILFFVNFIFFK
jgi:hypothetical protein